MKTIQYLEKMYLQSFEDQSDHLEQIFKSYFEEDKNKWWDFKENNYDITKTIINRLKAFYNNGNDIKKLVNKNKLSPASDFFVEQVVFFVNLYFSKVNPGLVVRSEKRINLQGGKYIVPDISIWDDKDKPVAVIECKTQLGFNRSNWDDDFNKRMKKLPNVKWFYLVMTGDNWGGFPEEYKKKKKYFCLLDEKTWPNKFEDISQINNRIEDLFLELKKLKKVSKDQRLVNIFKDYSIKNKEVKLIRNYLGKDYLIILDKFGRLTLNDSAEVFPTPNTLYNGIVSFVKQVKSSSGHNDVGQFTIKSTGEVLSDKKYPNLNKKTRN